MLVFNEIHFVNFVLQENLISLIFTMSTRSYGLLNALQLLYIIIIRPHSIFSLDQNDLSTGNDTNRAVNDSTFTTTLSPQVLYPTNASAFNLTFHQHPNLPHLVSPGERHLNEVDCRIFAIDEFITKRIRMKVDVERMTLIEYRLTFPNYTLSPLRRSVGSTHKADTWTRVSSLHGRTLLSLAFNYGIVSLMTLTINTDTEHVSNAVLLSLLAVLSVSGGG